MMIISFQVLMVIILIGSFINIVIAENKETKNMFLAIYITCVFGYIVSITI